MRKLRHSHIRYFACCHSGNNEHRLDLNIDSLVPVLNEPNQVLSPVLLAFLASLDYKHIWAIYMDDNDDSININNSDCTVPLCGSYLMQTGSSQAVSF